MVISDNGASAEGGVTGSFNEMRFFNQVPESFEDNLAHIDDLGGPSSYNHYAWGWAWAGDTPFRRWKRETYRGGSTDPFVLAWPAGMAARGEVRTQYAHAIDMVPTVLDALGIEPPEAIRGVPQTPLEGVSFAHTFDDARGAVQARHAVLRDVRPPRDLPRRLARGVPVAGAELHRGGASSAASSGQPITPEILDELDRSGWELYRMADDPSESRDVAAEHPEVVRDLIARWWEEAEKYKVLPLDGSMQARLATVRPQTSKPRTRFVYYPGGSVVPAFAAPPVYNRAVLDRGRRRHPRRRRRGRAAGPGRRRRRLRLLHEGRPALLPLQLRRPRPLRGAGRGRRPHARAGTRCATSSSRPARRTSPTARASRDAGSCTSTASSSARPSSRTRRRCSSSSKG